MRAIVMPTFWSWSLVALDAVIMTTSSANRDDKVGIMTSLWFKWKLCNTEYITIGSRIQIDTVKCQMHMILNTVLQEQR